MDKIFYYKDLTSYIQDILQDIKMSMEIRIITNQLFIEKVQFLDIELRTKNEIFEELLNQDYELIKSISAKYTGDKDVMDLKLSHKFMYHVEQGPILFYFVWSDNLGNLLKPGRPFQIVNEGDTLTLR